MVYRQIADFIILNEILCKGGKNKRSGVFNIATGTKKTLDYDFCKEMFVEIAADTFEKSFLNLLHLS